MVAAFLGAESAGEAGCVLRQARAGLALTIVRARLTRYQTSPLANVSLGEIAESPLAAIGVFYTLHTPRGVHIAAGTPKLLVPVAVAVSQTLNASIFVLLTAGPILLVAFIVAVATIGNRHIRAASEATMILCTEISVVAVDVGRTFFAGRAGN